MTVKQFSILLFNIFLLKGIQAHVAGDQCPRYHVQEFYAAVFQPLFQHQIQFTIDMLEVTTEAAEEMLKKVEEKKGTDGKLTEAGNFELDRTSRFNI